MALHSVGDRAGDRQPNYQDAYLNGRDVMGVSVHSAENQKVGRVCDLLADEAGNLRSLVVRLGFWKKVTLPVERCTYVSHAESTGESSPHEDHIYVSTLNQEAFEALANYLDSEVVDTGTDIGTESVAQPSEQYQMAPLEQSVPTIQLYEERLVAQKQRIKTGEVKISRRTVTETADVSMPVTKEKIIIEIESIYGGETRVNFGDAQVSEDGTVRMGIYEEQAEICRRIVPYQNVSVRKEVVQDVVKAQEPLRREELAVQSNGIDYVDRRGSKEDDFVEDPNRGQ